MEMNRDIPRDHDIIIVDNSYASTSHQRPLASSPTSAAASTRKKPTRRSTSSTNKIPTTLVNAPAIIPTVEPTMTTPASADLASEAAAKPRRSRKSNDPNPSTATNQRKRKQPPADHDDDAHPSSDAGSSGLRRPPKMPELAAPRPSTPSRSTLPTLAQPTYSATTSEVKREPTVISMSNLLNDDPPLPSRSLPPARPIYDPIRGYDPVRESLRQVHNYSPAPPPSHTPAATDFGRSSTPAFTPSVAPPTSSYYNSSMIPNLARTQPAPPPLREPLLAPKQPVLTVAEAKKSTTPESKRLVADSKKPILEPKKPALESQKSTAAEPENPAVEPKKSTPEPRKSAAEPKKPSAAEAKKIAAEARKAEKAEKAEALKAEKAAAAEAMKAKKAAEAEARKIAAENKKVAAESRKAAAEAKKAEKAEKAEKAAAAASKKSAATAKEPQATVEPQRATFSTVPSKAAAVERKIASATSHPSSSKSTQSTPSVPAKRSATAANLDRAEKSRAPSNRSSSPKIAGTRDAIAKMPETVDRSILDFGKANPQDEPASVSIVIEVPLLGETNKYINFMRLAEEKYGWDALHPRQAAQRERKARIAAASAALERSASNRESADDMSVDLQSDVDASNAEVGGANNHHASGHEEPARPARKKRFSKEDEYDQNDDFVDDSELMWENQAAASKDGFFVYSGPLKTGNDNTGNEPPKRGRGGRARGGARGKAAAAASTDGAAASAPVSNTGRGRGAAARNGTTTRKPRPTKAEREQREREKAEQEAQKAAAHEMSSFMIPNPGQLELSVI